MTIKEFSDEWHWYTNPDGSEGGMVSNHASVEEGATIAKGAIVTAGAHVSRDTTLSNGQFATDGGVLQFDVK